MRRLILGGIGVSAAGVALAWSLQAQETVAPAQADPAAAQETAEEPAATPDPDAVEAEGPTLAFRFTDRAQMEQFAQVWQLRQAALTRMTVLQAYWSEEQARLQEVNDRLLSEYNLDISKVYTLDTDRLLLYEGGQASITPPTAIDQPMAPAPPAGTSAQAE